MYNSPTSSLHFLYGNLLAQEKIIIIHNNSLLMYFYVQLNLVICKIYEISETEEIIDSVISPYSFKIVQFLLFLSLPISLLLYHFISPFPLETEHLTGFITCCLQFLFFYFPFKPLHQAFVLTTLPKLFFPRLLMTITL